MMPKTLEEFSIILLSIWKRFDDEANELKDSHRTLSQLKRLYLSMSSHEQRLTNTIIGEWLSQSDPKMRFDAMAMIEEFSMQESIPNLKAFIHKSQGRVSPSEKFEVRRAKEILDCLTEEK